MDNKKVKSLELVTRHSSDEKLVLQLIPDEGSLLGKLLRLGEEKAHLIVIE